MHQTGRKFGARRLSAAAAVAGIVGVPLMLATPAFGASAAPATGHGATSGHAGVVRMAHRQVRTVPGTPGVPQAPTTVYTEDFEHGVGNTPMLLTGYTGAPPTSATYTADAPWLTACNGDVTNFNSTGNGNCVATGDANALRQLAWALGSFAGAATPGANHAVGAYTENNPGANNVQFQTVNPIPLTAANRFLAFSVDYGAANCFASAPMPTFFLTNGATTTPVGGAINACSSPTTITAPAVNGSAAVAVKVGTYTSNGAVLFSGSSVGITMRNQNGSGGGNDGAFDNIKILDATPQLDKSFSPASVPQGGTSTLTLTVTNTTELGAKNGWSFTDALPTGLSVGAAATTTCPSGVVTATPGSSSVAVTGNLNAGMASCTVTVPVTSPNVATYTNGPANVTGVGVNAPGSATVAFTPVVNLAVTKTATPSPYVPDSPLTYTVKVANSGPSSAVGATVSDPLPPALAGFTWTCAASAGASCTGSGSGSISDTVTVPSGGNVTYTVTGTAPAVSAGALSNTATATPAAGESDPGCPVACSATALDAAPLELVIHKSSSPAAGPAPSGTVVTYTVTVTNPGALDYPGATFTDNLSGVLDLAHMTGTPTATAGNVTTAPESLTWIGTVPAGGTVTVTYQVTVN